MGDMADAILNGDFDEVTGEYIGPGDGHPRSFHYPRVPNYTHSLRGVRKYVLHRLPKADLGEVVNAYIPGEGSVPSKCSKIQQDFGTFVKWFKNYEKIQKTH